MHCIEVTTELEESSRARQWAKCQYFAPRLREYAFSIGAQRHEWSPSSRAAAGCERGAIDLSL
jgi:hypothetical protein